MYNHKLIYGYTGSMMFTFSLHYLYNQIVVKSTNQFLQCIMFTYQLYNLQPQETCHHNFTLQLEESYIDTMLKSQK